MPVQQLPPQTPDQIADELEALIHRFSLWDEDDFTEALYRVEQLKVLARLRTEEAQRG